MKSLSCIVFGAALLAACSAEGERTALLVSPDMSYSIPYDPYDPNENFANGATLQLPPEGTVPVGSVYFGYGPSRDEAERASREVHNPIEASPLNLKRGKQVFETFCSVCHDLDATGGKKGAWPMTGPNLTMGRPVDLGDGGIFHIITKGQGTMASYAKQVRTDDRWRAVLHLRTLQQGAK